MNIQKFRGLIILAFLVIVAVATSQTNSYSISFENAVHHEARVTATFPQLKSKALTVRMSRTSPGRYALHEFAKNVYALSAKDSKGNNLTVERSDPYSWEITGHDGTVTVEYILFADRADGTYSQIDESHAHLNIPATFIYAEGLEHRPVEVDFQVRKDLDWKVATQLNPKTETTFTAPHLQYFMDSPTEISDFDLREFTVDGQNIRFVLHHTGSDSDFETYFNKVKRIVLREKAVFGELPNFDYGTYTFIACYLPHVSGDGMEHRNSTILTDTEGLAEGGMENNIGTVSHEFFHAWNVERIRPDDLEPFDFTKTNMTGALWFAEGFTSYYTNLILCRAQIITPSEYVNGLNGTFNYVWNSAALQYFNPIEMSYQAPFVDAARSVDPVNRGNTFVSYYSYGSVLGLALDLSLREKGLNLDDYMKLVWERFGKNEVAYTVSDLESTLQDYAGTTFATDFFGNYIYQSEMPNYAKLFQSVGLTFTKNSDAPLLGLSLEANEEGLAVRNYTDKGSPAYNAGLDKGDVIISINGEETKTMAALASVKENLKTGDKLNIEFMRFGEKQTAQLMLSQNNTYLISINADANKNQTEQREKWLGQK